MQSCNVDVPWEDIHNSDFAWCCQIELTATMLYGKVYTQNYMRTQQELPSAYTKLQFQPTPKPCLIVSC